MKISCLTAFLCRKGSLRACKKDVFISFRLAIKKSERGKHDKISPSLYVNGESIQSCSVLSCVCVSMDDDDRDGVSSPLTHGSCVLILNLRRFTLNFALLFYAVSSPKFLCSRQIRQLDYIFSLVLMCSSSFVILQSLNFKLMFQS